MPPAVRYPPPSQEEIAVGTRMRRIRKEYGISRSLLATQTGMSADQINRVERGRVALRLGPGWDFCVVTGTHPLWLAFGDEFKRVALWSTQQRISDAESGLPFLRCIKEVRAGRRELHLSETSPQADINRLKIKTVAGDYIKRYLKAMPTTEVIVPTWEVLRSWLIEATVEPGAKASLAREFNVKPAAVSQWLSGATAPTAQTTLRLLNWVVERTELNKKSAGGVSEARPARTTRVRKSKHEKPNSDRKKK